MATFSFERGVLVPFAISEVGFAPPQYGFQVSMKIAAF
jgi:hypothetical protein